MESNEKTKKKSVLTVKTIAYSAVFVALCVVANAFQIPLGVGGSNMLSLTYTVCVLAGALLGPLPGFIVGAAGDALGWLINPAGGAFNPVITLVTGLIGLIAGLVFWTMRKKTFAWKDIVLTVVAYVFVLLICTNLNTLAMYFYFFSEKYSLGAYYLIRVPKQIIFWALNLILTAVLIVPLKKILKR